MNGRRTVGARVVHGEGYAISSIGALVSEQAPPHLQTALDLTAFGFKALVLEQGACTPPHRFATHEELYFVYRGRVCLELDDVDWFVLDQGGLARVDPPAVRRLRNAGDQDAIVLVLSGQQGHLGAEKPEPWYVPDRRAS